MPRYAPLWLSAVSALALAACAEDIGEPLETSANAPSEAGSATATTGDAPAAGSGATIQIVGSSTVYPFTTTVAEQFGAKTEFPTPIVESTGTGGGLKLFCDGVGADQPDFTNASRRIKASEYELCQSNGVTSVIEMPVGFDGIVVANVKTAPEMNLSSKQLFTALAAQIPASDEDCAMQDNPYDNWSEIDPSLPDEPIEVYGPPPTSGTRDAFVELGMERGAEGYPCLAELAETDETAFTNIAHTLREDGRWVDSGENDNAIVQTLIKTPSAFGVFGYSFLDQNSDRMRAARIDGVPPEYELISTGEYPISRTLFVYAKGQHVAITPGMEAFMNEFMSDDAMSDFGYLAEKGLIPLPPARLAEARRAIADLEPMGGPPADD